VSVSVAESGASVVLSVVLSGVVVVAGAAGAAGAAGEAGAAGVGVVFEDFDAADASADPPTARAASAASVTPSRVMRLRIVPPWAWWIPCCRQYRRRSR
jgi:hypothetical protein